jgi:hypothetical protein
VKVLTKHHATLDVTGTAANFDFTPVPLLGGNQGWVKVAPTVFYSKGYFDLAGLAIDDKTIVPSGITVQRGTFSGADNGVAGDSYEVLDVLTSIPVDLDNVTTVAQWLYQGVGMVGTTLNFEHVLYARRQRYTLDLDTNVAFFMKANETQMGSMSPTASDRIYSYRLVSIVPRLGSGITRLVTSNARHVMQLEAMEEPTYEYLMRLKRSYELQQTPDVD